MLSILQSCAGRTAGVGVLDKNSAQDIGSLVFGIFPYYAYDSTDAFVKRNAITFALQLQVIDVREDRHHV